MNFLDARRARMRHIQMDVGIGQQLAQLAAILASQGDHAHLALERRFGRRQHVGGIAGRRDRQQDVAGLAQGLHLLAEDLVETVVVADRRDDRGVGT